jgi:hypothetical protein
MENTYRIVPVRGHYEVYDNNGVFVVSGDTIDECVDDLTEIIAAQTRVEIKHKEIVA